VYFVWFVLTTVLVTGASGFVGSALLQQLNLQNFQVRAAVRTPQKRDDVLSIAVGEINSETNWDAALEDIDVVVHLAARVHVMRDTAKNPLDEFRKVNVEGTRHLAESAFNAGVKRFVYVSSIKANGEEFNQAYTEACKPTPQDDYGVSKWEAEQVLHEISAKTGLEVVIVRPPLVYGAGVKGNFSQMIKVLAKGLPLPFASVRNLRSFIYVENLVDVLILCAQHPAAVGQTYLVSDGEDISTPDLLRQLSSAMGKHAKLLPCSPVFMRLAGQLFGKSDQVNRLLGSLQVDNSKIRRELGWQPPYSLGEGLRLSIKSNDKKI